MSLEPLVSDRIRAAIADRASLSAAYHFYGVAAFKRSPSRSRERES